MSYCFCSAENCHKLIFPWFCDRLCDWFLPDFVTTALGCLPLISFKIKKNFGFSFELLKQNTILYFVVKPQKERQKESLGRAGSTYMNTNVSPSPKASSTPYINVETPKVNNYISVAISFLCSLLMLAYLLAKFVLPPEWYWQGEPAESVCFPSYY